MYIYILYVYAILNCIVKTKKVISNGFAHYKNTICLNCSAFKEKMEKGIVKTIFFSIRCNSSISRLGICK